MKPCVFKNGEGLCAYYKETPMNNKNQWLMTALVALLCSSITWAASRASLSGTFVPRSEYELSMIFLKTQVAEVKAAVNVLDGKLDRLIENR